MSFFTKYAPLYLERGWHPIPVVQGRKNPHKTKDPETPSFHGEDRRVIPLAEIDDYPAADLGVVPPRGVVAIDVDLDEAKGKDGIATVNDLQQRYGNLPATWKTTSRANGTGIMYYRLPKGHEDHRFGGKWGPGVDVIAPHLRHAKAAGNHPDTGFEYRWISPAGEHLYLPPHVEELPLLPEGWLAIEDTHRDEDLSHITPSHKPPDTWSSYVASCYAEGQQALHSQNRHDNVTAITQRLANAYASGHTEAIDALKLLEGHWLEVMAPERGEEEAESEYRRMSDSAMGKRVATVVPPAERTTKLKEILGERMEQQAAARTDESKGEWETMALGLKELEALPDLTWAIENCIPEGVFSTLYGPTGIGKTFVMLDMSLSLASGIDWLNIASKKQKVLYVVGEGVRGYKKRVRAWLKAHPGLNPDITFANAYGQNLRDPDALAGLAVYIKTHGFTFVVIDTVNMLAGGMDENASAEMGEFNTAMTVLAADTGATVVAVHHTGKDVKAGARGHSSFAGAVNSAILLTRDPELPILTIHFEKQRDAVRGTPIAIEMYSVEGTDSAALRLHTHTPEGPSMMRKLVTRMRTHTEPLTHTQLRHLSDLSRDKTDQIVRQLFQAGYVNIEGQGPNTTYSLTETGQRELP